MLVGQVCLPCWLMQGVHAYVFIKETEYTHAGPDPKRSQEAIRSGTLPRVDPAHHWDGCFTIKGSAL